MSEHALPRSITDELTVGVEEEFQLVHLATGELTPSAPLVVPRAEGADPTGGRVEHELYLSQVETASPVCASLTELRRVLGEQRAAVARAALTEGCGVVAAGTHPFAAWPLQQLTPKEPYVGIGERYAHLASEQLLFGCHVHVAIADPEERIQVLNHVRPWLAPLLALSASSPFWEGADTGYASYRYVVFGRWPTHGTPDPFASWADFVRLRDRLVDSGSIDAPGRLYWTVRPSAQFDTLEFRVSDVCTTLEEATMVAGLIRALAHVSLEAVRRGAAASDTRGELVRMAQWQAARFGLDDTLLDLAPTSGDGVAMRPAADVVGALVDHVRPGLEATGDAEAVEAPVARVLATGNSAARQRARVSSGASLTELVAFLREETAAGARRPARWFTT